MHLFINGLAASAGGGLTYLRNVIPQIAKRSGVQATVLVAPDLRQELPVADNLTYLDPPKLKGVTSRNLYEQLHLRAFIAKSGAQVLLSTGNFALRDSAIPQILLSRNALYTSAAFRKDLWSRGEYALLFDNWMKSALARKSIAWADYTVAPSEAFAAELRQWTGQKVLAVHHGFDRDLFLSGNQNLPVNAKTVLDRTQGALRLLFVSHYNYYRNFETLFKAMPALNRMLKEKKAALLLTCTLDGTKDGSYGTGKAAAMLRTLGISDNVFELGQIPHQSLHELYRACDMYVTPAYAETFAHPLVEAMASGLPIVASGLAVHKEICGDAALYFPCFSSEELAHCVAKIAESPDLRAGLSKNALVRSESFSWEVHVDELLRIAVILVEEKTGDHQR